AGTTLVERRRAGDEAVPRDRAVGGLGADGGGDRGGLADRATGVGADRERSLVRRERRSGTTTGATRDTAGVPRVAGGAVGRVLGGRTHRELVHVGLAEDGDPGLAQLRGERRVVGRDPALEDLRPARGGHVRGGEHVLERERHTGERRG